MKKNREWLLIFGSLLTSILLLYGWIFSWVVPKTAAWTIPSKWKMLPLQQSRSIVHDYLGDPIPRKDPKDSSYEEWVGGFKGKMYVLRIDYATDTMAVGYTIRFHYKNLFADRNYLIDSFSIKE